VGAHPASGQVQVQRWNSPGTLALVQLATHRRAQQLADTGLVDYQALAHGYVTFLAQVGVGFLEVPKIIKSDELMAEIYWHAPNQSKQRIIGHRDTLLLPADIQYYRDRFGIFQNNLPDLIRTGDGQDIRDVPHPLSPAGLLLYDYAVTDSLIIRTVERDIHVVEVTVRPKDDTKPRVIGALYIDPLEGQVVRMALTFTHAAFLDRRLDDVTVVLENRLVAGRFWLPSHQEIDVTRTGTWLDFPVRGIIKGRWEIGDYKFDLALPRTLFGGPEIVQAPAAEIAAYKWTGSIFDSLPPDVGQPVDADFSHIEEQARALVGAYAMARTQRLVVSAPSLSQFARVDRVEGLAPGFGLGQGLAPGLKVMAQGRFGLDDHAVKGGGSIQWQPPSGLGVRLFAQEDFRDAGDEAERSTIVNSFAAQEFGSDDSDPYDVRAYGAALSARPAPTLLLTAEGTRERDQPLLVHSTPASGAYESTLAIEPMDAIRLSFRVERTQAPWIAGTDMALTSEVRTLMPRGSARDVVGPDVRASLQFALSREIGGSRIVWRSSAADVFAVDRPGAIPLQESVMLGGPVTGPGYEYHEFAGSAGLSERLEIEEPIPFLPIPLGRFGRTPATATLAPFVSIVGIRGTQFCGGPNPTPSPVMFGRGFGTGTLCGAERDGWYPTLGLGLLGFFDLVRFDVARGLSAGRWTFGIDVARAYWGIL
ncbi:MAG TPA: hypothetical protein VMH39_00110, partial [Gemmatimonadaceae bacterium]|nr:hypothetical protein [Gemmatimonadaceae bacterium]